MHPLIAPRPIVVGLLIAAATAGPSTVRAVPSLEPPVPRTPESNVIWPAPTLGTPHPMDREWSDEFALPGFNGSIRAVLTDGDRVLIGGSFNSIGSVTARNVVAWDGVTLQPLGAGPPMEVDAIVRWGDSVIVAGPRPADYSSCAPSVWAWDGATWSPVGCTEGPIRSLAVWKGQLHAGMDDTVMRWTGTAWETASDGYGYTLLRALLPRGDSLYVAGGGGTGVKLLSGSGSLSVPGGPLTNLLGNARVNSLLLVDGLVHAAGTADRVNGVPLGSTIVKFDGTQWTGVGHASGESNGLALWNGQLIASIQTAAGAARVHRLEAGEWVPVDTSAVNDAATLVAVLDSAIVMSSTTRVNDASSSGPAVYEHGAWRGLREPWSGRMRGADPVEHLQPWNGRLLAVGPRRVGAGDRELATAGVVTWDGVEWESHPAPPNTTILAVDVDSTGVLYVAGRHSSGSPALVQRWNGSSWTAIAPSLPMGEVSDIEWYAGELYACGSFAWWDPDLPNMVAVHTGASWARPGGCGLEYSSSAQEIPLHLRAWNGRLFVGGEAFRLDCPGQGPYADGAAFFDGTGWSVPDAALPGIPGVATRTSAIHDGKLVLAGWSHTRYPFRSSYRPVTAWDGTSWHPLYAGALEVTALAELRGRLFGGGVFVRDDSTLTYGVAEWDGARWQLLGSGMNGPVTAIVEYGGDLYAAGSFGWANGKPSFGVARWTGFKTSAGAGRPARSPVSLSPVQPNPGRGAQRIAYTLPASARVRLWVHDVSGRRVVALWDGPKAAGAHVATWEGRDASGARVAPGMYFVKLRTDAGSATASLVRIE